jgi:glucose/arabinose dehydrogenase
MPSSISASRSSTRPSATFDPDQQRSAVPTAPSAADDEGAVTDPSPSSLPSPRVGRRGGRAAIVAAVAATGCTGPADVGEPVGTAPAPVVAFEPVGTFDEPVDMAWRRGDGGRYVVERDGRVVRLAEDGSVVTVLDITAETTSGGEQGLLGLTFAPNGELAYVNHTDRAGRTAIVEYAVAADGAFAAPRRVLDAPQPSGSHNGGDLAFGPDGMLYIGLGDGSAGGDADRVAADPASVLGKLLRIDPRPTAGRAYGVPADNPFVGQAGAAPEVWSSGLRNPWRFSFDRATGDLWIGDVGQDQREEIDVAPATGGRDAGKGTSFGWSAFEGELRYNVDVTADGHTPPFLAYPAEQGCAVSAGVRARGDATGSLEGWYVFGDWCAGKVWALEVIGAGPVMTAGRLEVLGDIGAVTALVDGPDGALYVISQHGPVFRLVPD